MNRREQIDDVLERWLDDGPDTAPERFVWAAIEQVERAPQRGAWRLALENMPMYAKLAVPVIGVAAALFAAVLLFTNLAGPDDVGESPSPSAQSSPASVAPAGEPVCSVDAVTSTRLQVTWCVPRGADRLVVEFSMEAPRTWAEDWFGEGEILTLRPPTGQAINFGLRGPDTIDEWLAQFQEAPEFELTEPETLTIDGVDAYTFDVRLAPGVSGADAPPLLDNVGTRFLAQQGSAARIVLVAYAEEALAIMTGAPESEFVEWADAVLAAVETIQWGP